MAALLQTWGDTMYDLFIGRWVWAVFREGPAWAGGWSGLSDADMCARLAPSSQVGDWLVGDDLNAVSARCMQMIGRAHGAYACAVHTLLYVAALAWAWSLVKHLHTTWILGRRVPRHHHHRRAPAPAPAPAPAAGPPPDTTLLEWRPLLLGHPVAFAPLHLGLAPVGEKACGAHDGPHVAGQEARGVAR